MKIRVRSHLLLLVLVIVVSACLPQQQSTDIRVRIIVDGKELTYRASDRISVLQLLQQANIRIDPLDRVNPSEFTPITDDMVITIVRVVDKQECVEQTVPYTTTALKSPDLPPNTTKIGQPGVNGTQRICYDVVYEDGVEKSRTAGNPTIIQQPVAEILYQGIDKTTIEPVAVAGMIAYISGGQARAVENNSRSDRVLPTGNNLDGRVFALSETGRQLLFTRKPEGTPTPETYNELWVLLDTSDPQAVPIHVTTLDNILTADWVPGQPYTFSYSTLQPREQAPGYQALNDLYVARIDSRTGKLLKADRKVTSRPTGVYAVWGTQFKWSPDGKNMAWAQADGAGLIDWKTGTFTKLFDFKVYSTTLSNNWVWMPELSWSPDGTLLATTIHGKPLGQEQAEFSPVFDVSLAQSAGLFQVNLVPQAGMWAAPQYSPLYNSDPVQGYIAYLKARSPIDSVSSEYDLVIADRDGSNARAVFPDSDKPGIKPIDTQFGSEPIWSPDGRQVAVIYQGNIWMVDAASGRANQVTLVDNAHHVRWTK